MPQQYKIRQMTREELDITVDWAAAEGWNPGLHDAEVFWRTDPDGFIAMEIDGKMVGSGAIVSYNSEFGFMGFFIVKPEYRGKGLGTKLWYYRRDILLSRLKKGATIGMDGVFDMQKFYAKGGFKFSHRNLRMEGVINSSGQNNLVEKITKDDFARVNEFDKKYFGYERETFLKGWLNLKDSAALKYEEDSILQGYGVIRKCRKGFKIGPLFAENYMAAEELFKSLSAFAKGDIIYLDVPEINKDAMKLASAYGMKECFGTARMYHGLAPNLPYNQIFGVTTFELG